MNKVFFIYFFLSIFLINSLMADDCSEMDLYKSPTSPLIKMPIVTQGGGTCYAFVAAQMLDYYNLKIGKYSGTYKFTSPLYLAWLAKYKSKFFFRDSTLHGGSIEELVTEDIEGLGMCSEEDIQKKVKKFTKSNQFDEASFYGMLAYIGQIQNERGENDQTDKALLQGFAKAYDCNDAQEISRVYNENKSLFDAPVKILEKVFKGCLPELRYAPVIESNNDLKDDDLAAFIDKNLQNDSPNAIDFCHRFITDKNAKDFDPVKFLFKYRQFSGQRNPDCDAHTLLLVGRKKLSNGQCSYLLRNSAGPKWYPDTASSCSCLTKNGEYKSECSKTEGATYLGCWFPKEKLLKNIYKAHGIQK